jgi:hypothetical protein
VYFRNTPYIHKIVIKISNSIISVQFILKTRTKSRQFHQHRPMYKTIIFPVILYRWYFALKKEREKEARYSGNSSDEVKGHS